MPCYDSGPRNTDSDAHYEIKRLKERLDKVSRLLCSLTKDMDLSQVDQELAAWVLDHRDFDERRKKQEGETLNELFKNVYKDKL